MRVVLRFTLLFLAAECFEAFTVQKQTTCHSATRCGPSILRRFGEPDDYDDFYADFNPAEFEHFNQDVRSQGNSGDVGHDYSRDPIDNSNVDVVAVNGLIADRLRFRKTGRFDEADQLRDELLRVHGVRLQDKDRVWRTGSSASGSGRQWSNVSSNERRGARDGRNAGRRQRPERDFGPTGHDYNLADDSASNTSGLAEDKIHELIAERLQCKMSRDFRRADDLQRELLENGVYVHDGFKLWRADGKSFEDFGARKYCQAPRSESTPYAQEIQELVDERAVRKAERLFQEADAIRDRLREEFNVQVDDKRCQWSVGGDNRQNQRRKEFAPCTMSPSSEVPEDFDEIQRLVDERDSARAQRNFQVADDIREELMSRNIMVDDKIRQWAVGRIQRKAADKRALRDWSRRGTASGLSEEDENTISEMLLDRDEFKKRRDYEGADKIRDTLRAEFSVRTDGSGREWYVWHEHYVHRKDAAEIVDAETLGYIQAQVEKRAEAKTTRDFDVADEISDELAESYQVMIDDRKREWFIAGESSRNTEEPYEDEIAMSAGSEEAAITGNESSVEQLDESDLDSLTIPELKEKLREANLPVSGKKAELIERLMSG